MGLPRKYRALVVKEMGVPGTSDVKIGVEERQLPHELNAGEVIVKVAYSSLNYKDALAVSGNRGVVRVLPLVPGIDAVGQIVATEDSRFLVGQSVLIAHPKFGTAVDGGLAEYTKVPGDWVFNVPPPLKPVNVASIGTAGFTAVQSILQLQQHGVEPGTGPVVVTGATGGVGMFAVSLMGKLGYQVTAVSGKADRFNWLCKLGASEVIGRDEIADGSSKPVLSGRWAGAVDTVGGDILVDVIRTAQRRACVTACGNVAGADLQLTVFPFILRGVTLCGIDSTGIERAEREKVWAWLAERSTQLPDDGITQTIDLAQVPLGVQRILQGEVAGRLIVRIA